MVFSGPNQIIAPRSNFWNAAGPVAGGLNGHSRGLGVKNQLIVQGCGVKVDVGAVGVGVRVGRFVAVKLGVGVAE